MQLQKLKYILLSKQFYIDYNTKQYPEIERKKDRPYIMLLVKIKDLTFAIPFRSHIYHHYCFLTDKKTKSGIDYSKAIVLSKNYYIDSKKPFINPAEHKFLSAKSSTLIKSFSKYINEYKNAANNDLKRTNYYLHKYSTLQYFHNELKIQESNTRANQKKKF
jgi:hypothetical protein